MELDHPELFSRERDGSASVYCLRRKQSGCAQLRAWLDLGAEDRKIRVDTVRPGPIETPALENAGLIPEQVSK